MPAPYSQDLRERAIKAIESGDSYVLVSESFNINRNTLSDWHKRYRQTGDYSPKQGYQRGHSHRITNWEAFRAFVHQHGEKTQAEMAQAWPGEMSEDAIRRGLKKIGFTKKKTYAYRERDEQKRQTFLAKRAQLEAHQLIYLDEAGIDDTEDYGYGWCACGQRFEAVRQGSRKKRVSFIAALHQKSLIAPMTYEGYCNRAVFEVWLEQALLPSLQPGQVIICDNATFHKGGQIEALIQQANCELLYLPPYSPDLNPIEHEWFVLKNRMRKQIQSGQPFRQVVNQAFVDVP
ncbi:MAG: IS630 family transposase [Cyanobacteria bacterium P01_A01_bin.116]